jgi:hypothetical protein
MACDGRKPIHMAKRRLGGLATDPFRMWPLPSATADLSTGARLARRMLAGARLGWWSPAGFSYVLGEFPLQLFLVSFEEPRQRPDGSEGFGVSVTALAIVRFAPGAFAHLLCSSRHGSRSPDRARESYSSAVYP